VPFSCEINDGVRGRQDGLSGAVVAVQRDDVGRGLKLLREIKNVADGCGTKRVNRLCIIADDR